MENQKIDLNKYPGHFSFIFFSICLLAIILSGCAQNKPDPRIDLLQSNTTVLEKRIVELENQTRINSLKQTDELEAFKKEISDKLANARRSQRFFIKELDQLKKDIQTITAENEKTLQKIHFNSLEFKKVQKKIGDLIISIDELKAFFNDNLNVSSESKAMKGDEIKIFKKAHLLYKKRQLINSQKLFLLYREKAPNTELTDDALYYFAYIHFLQKQYEQAILHFFELIKQYPKSNWSNDAKWWLAISLERTEDMGGARDIYLELERLPESNSIHYKAKRRLEELQNSK
jgi:TolA-binding protein